MERKQALIVRSDLSMTPGKLAAQVAHASQFAAERARGSSAHTIWRAGSSTKVVLEVADEAALLALRDDAEVAGLPHALVTDEGRTEVPTGTVTALGVGPDWSEAVDTVTGDLELLR
jgi:PTH2 family peptidyl-tRNA hydrolase